MNGCYKILLQSMTRYTFTVKLLSNHCWVFWWFMFRWLSTSFASIWQNWLLDATRRHRIFVHWIEQNDMFISKTASTKLKKKHAHRMSGVKLNMQTVRYVSGFLWKIYISKTQNAKNAIPDIPSVLFNRCSTPQARIKPQEFSANFLVDTFSSDR